MAGVAGIYPALLPRLVPALAAAALAAPSAASPLAATRRERARYASALLTVLALAVVIVAPIQSLRAVHYVAIIDGVRSVGEFPVLDPAAYGAILAGAESHVPLLSGAALGPGAVWGALAVGIAAALVALALGSRAGRDGEARVLVALTAVAATITALALAEYGWRAGYGYGAIKALGSGGAILAGLLVLGLVLLARRRLPGATALAGLGALACLAVWAPTSWQLLDRTATGTQGMRAEDLALSRALARLPAGSAVLVTSAHDSPGGYKLRRAAEYLVTVETDHKLVNVGLYGATGDPDRAWDYVVTGAGASLPADGRTVWRDAHYRLSAAPALAVAPTGAGWRAVTPDRAGLSGDLAPHAALSVANRAGGARAARLRVAVRAVGTPHRVELSAGPRRAAATVVPGAPAVVRLAIDVPVEGVTHVGLRSRPIRPGGAPASPRVGLRVLRASATPAPERLPAGQVPLGTAR